MLDIIVIFSHKNISLFFCERRREEKKGKNVLYNPCRDFYDHRLLEYKIIQGMIIWNFFLNTFSTASIIVMVKTEQ